jgi:hypothetical protein
MTVKKKKKNREKETKKYTFNLLTKSSFPVTDKNLSDNNVFSSKDM